MPNRHYLGPNVAYWTEKYHLSVSYLADQLEMSSGKFIKVMSGEFPVTDTQLITLANIFAVPPKYLMPDALDPDSDEYKMASLKSFARDRVQ